MDYKDWIIQLKSEREIFELANIELKKKRDIFEVSIVDDVNRVNALKASVNNLIIGINAEAIKVYEAIPKEDRTKEDKKILGGVKIIDSATIEYEENKAFPWAKEKLMFLIFDKKAFEKAAKSLDLDWVTLGTIPKVQFPKVIKLED